MDKNDKDELKEMMATGLFIWGAIAFFTAAVALPVAGVYLMVQWLVS